MQESKLISMYYAEMPNLVRLLKILKIFRPHFTFMYNHDMEINLLKQSLTIKIIRFLSVLNR